MSDRPSARDRVPPMPCFPRWTPSAQKTSPERMKLPRWAEHFRRWCFSPGGHMEPWFAVTTGTPFPAGAASWCSPKRDFRNPTSRSTSSTNQTLLIVSHSKNCSTSSILYRFGHKLFIEKNFTYSHKKHWTGPAHFSPFFVCRAGAPPANTREPIWSSCRATGPVAVDARRQP